MGDFPLTGSLATSATRIGSVNVLTDAEKARRRRRDPCPAGDVSRLRPGVSRAPELAGKRVKCPKCAHVIAIPKPQPEPEPELEVAEAADEPVSPPAAVPSNVRRWLFYTAVRRSSRRWSMDTPSTPACIPTRTGTSAQNLNVAKSLTNGEGYANPFEEKTGPTAWMPPILSTLLAGLIWLCEDDVNALQWIVVGIQVHVMLLTGWLVVALARKTTAAGDRVVHGGRGLLPRSALAVSPLLPGDARLLARLARHGRVCLRPLLASAARVEPFRRPLGTLRGHVLADQPDRRLRVDDDVRDHRDPQRRWKPIAIALLIATLVHAPWTIRNFLLFGRIIPIKSNLAYELYQSQCLQKDGLLQGKTFGTHPYAHPNKARREYKQKGEMEFLDEKRQLFYDAVLADPLDFCDRVVSRFLGCLVWYQPFDIHFERSHPWVTWLNRVLHPLPLLAILVLAYSEFWRPLHPAMWAVIGIFLLYQIPYVIISYYERYAIPALGTKAILTFWLIDRVWSLIARTPLPAPGLDSRIRALAARDGRDSHRILPRRRWARRSRRRFMI